MDCLQSCDYLSMPICLFLGSLGTHIHYNRQLVHCPHVADDRRELPSVRQKLIDRQLVNFSHQSSLSDLRAGGCLRNSRSDHILGLRERIPSHQATWTARLVGGR